MADPSDSSSCTTVPSLNEVVFGVQWNESSADEPDIARKVDLDASCILLDVRNEVVDIVHPGKPRNANGSVVHTGDCKSGGGSWDRERIYVFLNALPEQVRTILFVVTSVNRVSFEQIGSVRCHVTDHATEQSLFEIDLGRLSSCTADVVARLLQVDGAWQLEAGRALDGQA
jgi:stress response protein SCP2